MRRGWSGWKRCVVLWEHESDAEEDVDENEGEDENEDGGCVEEERHASVRRGAACPGRQPVFNTQPL